MSNKNGPKIDPCGTPKRIIPTISESRIKSDSDV